MVHMLDGRALARTILSDVRQRAAIFCDQYGRPPGLAVVQVGHDPASDWYVRQIKRVAEKVGLRFELRSLKPDTSQTDLDTQLQELALDMGTQGILLQLPLPSQLDSQRAINNLDPRKDIDGVHPLNAGRLFQHSGSYRVPATPAGGMALLKQANVPTSGKHAVIVGRSTIVGRPMAMLLLHQNATVTICHSRTKNLADETRRADILAVAVGRPGLITGEMVKPGATVIDFGVTVIKEQLVGDVEADSVSEVAGWLTPVPGGTGPMTTAMLLQNTLAAAEELLASH